MEDPRDARRDDAATATGASPLLDALRQENARLRDQNRALADQLAAAQATHASLNRSLRVTAPLRRIQEALRMRGQERRRRASQLPVRPNESPDSGGQPAGVRPGSHDVKAPASGMGAAVPASVLAITDAQAARHPLLARTRAWAAGELLLPEPDIRPIRTGCAGRVLVIAHVFYAELWPELAERIARIPGEIDLVVTLVEGRSDGLADAVVAQFPEVLIETLPNRGRDMWPLVRVVELGLVGDHDAVLKLHTKASVHRVDGAAWRARMLDTLCPSAEGIGLILELLRRDSSVGMIASAGGVLGRSFWGSNGLLIDALGARSGIVVDPDQVWFPGGSMFWSRPGPVNRLRDAWLAIEDFEHETVSIDGTAAHALERFLGALVIESGQCVISTDEVAARLAAALALAAAGAGE